MLQSDEFRQLLIADMALVMKVVEANDVAAALMRYWDQREKSDISLASELIRIADPDPRALDSVEEEVDRLITNADGDARAALTRHGGLDRSIHVALSRTASTVSMALTEVGAGARAPLSTVRADRYIDFTPTGERGGMGLVYMALDTELNRLVAFKMVRPDGGSGAASEMPKTPIEAATPARDTPASEAFEELKARFLQEAWITGGLEHPGIVPVYELGQTDAGIPYYTMRFVRGQRTLKSAIDEVRDAPIEDRLKLIEPFLKLCDSVRYAHSRGVIHRDLKPENVALGQFGEVVLLDWGLAKLEGLEDIAASRWQKRVREFREAGDLRTVVGALGTPGYMSPEAATGQLERVDARSDVYSLGVVLFEMLTGRLPFEFSSYAQYLDCMANKDAPAVRELTADAPQALSELCASCLSRDRTLRPEDVRTLSEAVRSWQAASAIEREVEGLLRDVGASLDAAEAASGDGRLLQVDRALAALHQIELKQQENPSLLRQQERAQRLREAGIRERERASGKRLLYRVGMAALLILAIGGYAAAFLINQERREKTEALEQVERLADSKEAGELIAEAGTLWPLHPDKLPDMEAWTRRVVKLLESRPFHEQALQTLRKRALPYTDADRKSDDGGIAERLAGIREEIEKTKQERAELEAAGRDLTGVETRIQMWSAGAAELEPLVGVRNTWRFAEKRDEWRQQLLTDLLAQYEELQGGSEGSGLLHAIRERLAFSTTLRERSVDDHESLWSRTIEEIATSPKYDGVRIAPQLGLVPLGKDPDSELFEFAHLGSGTIPERDETTRRLILEDEFAIVFVLVPGGSGRLGAQSRDPKEPNFDPMAMEDEEFPFDQTVATFLISKFECTQSQWVHMTGGLRPSIYQSENWNLNEDSEIAPLHPVEAISWFDAMDWLGRHLMHVPTESEWEWACRAGTSTPWETGGEAESLKGAANIKGEDDGQAVHAPVGQYRPNRFGLYDVHGNVWEWCADEYGEAVDRRLDKKFRAARGGSWFDEADFARSANRAWFVPVYRSHSVGVRPARHVTLK